MGDCREFIEIAHLNKNKNNSTKLNKTKPTKDNSLVKGLISTVFHLTNH